MTGLDLTKDRMIEIAALVTDSELNVLGEGVDIVIGAPAGSLDGMEKIVADMHAASGLTELVRSSTVTVADAERRGPGHNPTPPPGPPRVPPCGGSISPPPALIAPGQPRPD